MPGPIQVIPPGLMGLLQLKTGGNLPSQLADTVAPVLELRDWYLTARRLDQGSLYAAGVLQQLVLASAALGFHPFPGSTVPQNQIWFVEEMTVQVLNQGASVATDVFRAACAIGNTTAGLELLTGPDASDYLLVARARQVLLRGDRGFWAFPGDQFGLCTFDVLTTNGFVCNLFLRATPCPI